MPTPRPPVTEHRQCIVVGAGILGLAAAWSLSRRGGDVLVLDTDPPGHAGAGSKGSARIFRLSYEDPLYVQMAATAGDRWRALEAECDRELLHQVGLLSFGQHLADIAAALTRAGAAFERLPPDQAADRFPQLCTEGPALFEATAGVLRADACLQAFVDTGSFELRPGIEVRGLRDDEGGATVILAEGRPLHADVVVNCAGPRALSLMGGAPVPVAAPPSLQQVVYLGAAAAALDPALPLFIDYSETMVYGLPVPDQPTLKLSHHGPGPSLTGAGVAVGDDPQLMALLEAAARRLLPTMDPRPVATERCLYDHTLDGDFIIDRVGHLVVGCGTSGHGFKFGPLLGELLADLALGTESPADLRRFAATRAVRAGSATS